MKFEKTASGSQKITMSKAEWLHIGKQAGWAFEQIPDNWIGRIDLMGRNEEQILKNPLKYFEALFGQFKKERRKGETDKQLLQLTKNYLSSLFGGEWERAGTKEIRKIKSEFSKWLDGKMKQFPETEDWEKQVYWDGGALHVPFDL